MLFPELESSGLVGIARLAAEGEVLQQKRQVYYSDLETRSWISKPKGRPMPFDWAINPYRGCEFGCKYCYARYTHEFLDKHDALQFEREIFVKKLNPHAFRKELAKIPVEDGIAIGTATDPYQPAERKYERTRQILELFQGEQGRTLSITTKSDLFSRDVDLMRSFAARNEFCVLVTITTTDIQLARLLEPMAPRPDLRLASIRVLADAGVQVAVLASPVIPLITDSEENLTAVATACAAAGARYLTAGPLFLKPCAQKAFFPFLEEHFPHLLRRYRERYEKSAFLSGHYPDMIAKRVRAIREKAGLVHQPGRYDPKLVMEDSQLALFSPSIEVLPQRSTPERRSPAAQTAALRQRSR